MKDAFYFPHDSNARTDPKIAGMIHDYGLEGYGRYWVLIEVLREQDGYKLKHAQYVSNAVAMQMQCTADAAHEFVYACIEKYELLQSDGDFFWSESLKRRMETKDEKSKQARAAAEARWGKPNGGADSKKGEKNANRRNADAMRTQSDRNAKEKKRREPKIKESINKDNASSSESGKIIRLYESEGFGNITQFVGQEIENLMSEYPVEWIVRSMKEAVGANKRTLQYMRGCLRNWKAEGGPKERANGSTGKTTSTKERDPRYSAFYELFPDA